MERVWGGRRLEETFGRQLPPGATVGETWEIVDRPEAQSVVRGGPLAGRTLHELWTRRRAEIFGEDVPDAPRFPLLCKWIDARDRLSLQVHPPAAVCPLLRGEPKTELWYVAHADPGSELFAGLVPGVTRDEFEDGLREGHAADCVQRLPVRGGDAMFLPSGRLHAIGAGLIIAEVQQNSDTTYRVFDWNRPGLDGRPRQLHVAESLLSIDWDDHSPTLCPDDASVLVDCPCFRVERLALDAPQAALADHAGRFAICTVLDGQVECSGASFGVGDWFLVPASLDDAQLTPTTGPASVLRTTIPPEAA